MTAADTHIVLSSDGVFDVMTPDELLTIIDAPASPASTSSSVDINAGGDAVSPAANEKLAADGDTDLISATEATERILAAALEKGSTDNCSCIVVRILQADRDE